MPTAHDTSGPIPHALYGVPPDIHWEQEDGTAIRVLDAPLAYDLGEMLPALHEWDGMRGRIARSEHGTTVVKVPAGTRSNGASIPLLLQSRFILGPKENYETAAMVHDPLYEWQAPRGASDRAFRIIAEAGSKQVGRVRGFFGWIGLRVGGWVAYRRHGKG